MRVFIAGATGAIGARLVPRLVEQGHEVVGKHFDRSFAETNRLRTEGTDALLAAGREAGVQRFVAQSFAGWPQPAPIREWLPALAEAIGAKPPHRLPRWLARLVAGEAGMVLMTEIRGASNAKAKRELGWTLRYPSWRQGFPAAYRGGAATGDAPAAQ